MMGQRVGQGGLDTPGAAGSEPRPAHLVALMRSRPRQVPVTSALLLLNVLVFVVMLGFGAGLIHSANGVQLAWGANFGPATQDGQWWRLLTAVFIHFGIVHLAFNVWALWDIGRLVERLYGRLRFAAIYLLSGILGNLLSLVLHGNQAVSGGASGAVFSLYGALLVFLWRERRQVEVREFRWLFGVASFFTLLMLGMGLLVPGIDNAAHAGGLTGGALLGALLARPWVGAPAPQAPARVVAALTLTTVVALAIMNLPAPSYRFGDELRARQAIQQFLRDERDVSQHWDAILDAGRRDQLSFDQLAGRIDNDVVPVYTRSFEQLAAARPAASAPSARTLEALQTYAGRRADAARELADGLRGNDSERIRNALNRARQSPAGLTGAAPPASGPAQRP